MNTSPWSLGVDIAPKLPQGKSVEFSHRQGVLASIGSHFDKEASATHLVLSIDMKSNGHSNIFYVTNEEGLNFDHDGPLFKSSHSDMIFDAVEAVGRTYIAADRAGFFLFIKPWVFNSNELDGEDYDELPE